MPDAVDNTITADDVVDTKVVPPAAAAPAAEATTAEVKPAVLSDAEKPVAVQADWPADWREKAAGGDQKKLERLSRYASPQALADALLAAQAKIRSGDLKAPAPKDGTPEELAAWRASVGIPESPDKYDITLDNGLAVDPDTKPMVDKYLAAAHASNQTPEQVKATLASFYEARKAAADARAEADQKAVESAQDALQAEWGTEYRRDVNLIKGFLDSAPDGLRDRLINGRLADGTPVGSDPTALKWLLSLALERNPTGVIVPGGGGDPMKGLEDEIKSIEKTMRENRSEYNRDISMQKRYHDLLDARLKSQARAA